MKAIDPGSRVAELDVTRSPRTVPVQPGPSGEVALVARGVRMPTVDGPALRLTWAGGQVDI